MPGLSSRCLRLLACAVAAGFLATAPAHGEKKPKARSLDLTDTVFANRITTKFALLLRNSNLASFYSSRGPFTLFLPTDSAFSKIPPDELQALLLPENQDLLQRIVLFHLVNGNRYSSKDLLKLKTLPSCEGTALTIRTSRSGAQYVQKAKILHADIRCENGLIDQVDTVLIPPGLVLPKPGDPPRAPAPDASAPTNAPASSGTTNAAPAATNTPSADTNTAPPPAPATTNLPATNAP